MLKPILTIALASLIAQAPAQGHPHFADNGALQWHKKLADAQAAARKQQKFVLVEYGRQA